MQFVRGSIVCFSCFFFGFEVSKWVMLEFHGYSLERGLLYSLTVDLFLPLELRRGYGLEKGTNLILHSLPAFVSTLASGESENKGIPLVNDRLELSNNALSSNAQSNCDLKGYL